MSVDVPLFFILYAPPSFSYLAELYHTLRFSSIAIYQSYIPDGTCAQGRLAGQFTPNLYKGTHVVRRCTHCQFNQYMPNSPFNQILKAMLNKLRRALLHLGHSQNMLAKWDIGQFGSNVLRLKGLIFAKVEADEWQGVEQWKVLTS